MRCYGIRTFATNEDTHIADAHFLHQVELLGKAFSVATLTFAGQNCSIPEIRADELVLFIASIELTVLCRDKNLAALGLALTSNET